MINKYIAEFIGTFILVFAGCGACAINEAYEGSITHVGISLVFGFVVLAMIHAYGDTSGAHLNPAVTIAFFAAGRFSLKEVPKYVALQCLAATFACYILKYLVPDSESLGVTLPHAGILRSFIFELIFTFILMAVIINVATDSKEKGLFAGIAIGSTVALLAMFGGPVTGASMNPARSLGPALAAGKFTGLWLYMVAPVLGAVAALPFCQTLRKIEE